MNYKNKVNPLLKDHSSFNINRFDKTVNEKINNIINKVNKVITLNSHKFDNINKVNDQFNIKKDNIKSFYLYLLNYINGGKMDELKYSLKNN